MEYSLTFSNIFQEYFYFCIHSFLSFNRLNFLLKYNNWQKHTHITDVQLENFTEYTCAVSIQLNKKYCQHPDTPPISYLLSATPPKVAIILILFLRKTVRYNLHIIKSTHFQCSVQGFLVNLLSVRSSYGLKMCEYILTSFVLWNT